ncbi:MFS transporter [Peribacillus frigoritolerans]|nr:MFS transporter [Peribacillus frigoritolerans]
MYTDGLFVEARGGTYTGIGIAFLLAVLSEIPFMRIAGTWIHKIGLLPITLLAGTASLVRWVLYFTEPSLAIVYVSSIIQGFSLGLFIPAALQYIREVVPVRITVTAITLYSAIGNGLGNWFSTFSGGIILDKSGNICGLFFYGFLTLIGMLLTIWLMRYEKKFKSYIGKTHRYNREMMENKARDLYAYHGEEVFLYLFTNLREGRLNDQAE